MSQRGQAGPEQQFSTLPAARRKYQHPVSTPSGFKKKSPGGLNVQPRAGSSAPSSRARSLSREQWGVSENVTEETGRNRSFLSSGRERSVVERWGERHWFGRLLRGPGEEWSLWCQWEWQETDQPKVWAMMGWRRKGPDEAQTPDLGNPLSVQVRIPIKRQPRPQT